MTCKSLEYLLPGPLQKVCRQLVYIVKEFLEVRGWRECSHAKKKKKNQQQYSTTGDYEYELDM